MALTASLFVPADGLGFCYQYTYVPPAGALNPATVGQPYDTWFYVCCLGPVWWEVRNGTLPPGLSLLDNLNSTANLRGVPLVVGTWTFDVGVSGNCGSWFQSYVLTVTNPAGCGTIGIVPATLPAGTLNGAYAQQLTASGGTAPYSFFLAEGTLPPGLSLSNAGLLSGTTSTGGSFTFLVGATDAAGCNGTRSYTMTVSCPALSVLPPSLPPATLSVLYDQTLSGSGGSSPYTFGVTGGALPAGLSLYYWGRLYGWPQQAGTFPCDVTVTDQYGCSSIWAYVLDVGCAYTLTISPVRLPDGLVGHPYLQTLLALGGQPPYTFSLAGGTLPPALTLSADGRLDGVPAVHGRFPIDVRVVDALGCSAVRAYTLTVSGKASYVLGQGHGYPNPNRVRLVDQAGQSRADFYAYAAGQWGVNVAGGDLVGDAGGRALTGPGPGPVFGPQVRAFDAAGAAMAKINFYAYGTLKYGVDPAAVALDGDTWDEIVTGAGPGLAFPPHVRGFDFDMTTVRAIPAVNFYASTHPSYGARVAAGDLDGDRLAEMLTAPGPGATYAPTIRGWYYRGVVVQPMSRVAFDAFPAPQYGAEPAAGDVDADLYDEIAAAQGPGPTLPVRFRGFGFDDRAIAVLPGFDVVAYSTLFGGSPALGDLAEDGREDLATGAGPDPAAWARLKLYSYDGTTLLPEPMFLKAFPGGYGLQVASARLDL